jgi:hypothetical protein
LKCIDTTRKAVAIAMAVFGVGFVVCIHLVNCPWAMRAFAIGVYACLIATLALIVEPLARPANSTPFSLRSLCVRSLLILLTVVAVGLTMAALFGPGQAIGAVVGIFLLLAAVREHNGLRIFLAVLAAIVFSWTLLDTQSRYQFACWHAGEIVAAGCELVEKHPELKSGYEIQGTDPRVPSIFRKMGASSIVVGENRVAVYVPRASKLMYIPGQDRAEFLIYYVPSTTVDPEWIKWHGKGAEGHWKITDELWMIVDD